MILKLRIDSQDLRRFVPETYPAAESDALEDIVPVDVVVTLDALHPNTARVRRHTLPVLVRAEIGTGRTREQLNMWLSRKQRR
jgi:hypothetical protein